MICNNCGKEIGTGHFYPFCGASQTPNPPQNRSASKKSSTCLIIGIIAAVLGFSSSAHAQSSNKAKFTEVTSVADGVKKQVELCWFDAESFSQCNNNMKGNGWNIGASRDYATKYVSSITVNNGVITAKAIDGDGLNGATFTTKPIVEDEDRGIIKWEVVPEQSSCLSQDLCKTSSSAHAQSANKALTNKEKFTEITSSADGVKKQVELCWFDTGELSQCNNNKKGEGWRIYASEDYATRYVEFITVNNGVITAKAVDGDGLNGATITVKPIPDENSGMIRWQIVPEQSSCFSQDLCGHSGR